jgi:hypothetical protein
MSALALLFLSSDELRDLTDLKIAKAQMKWLDKNNYPYEISAAGKPKVLRSFLFNRFQNSKSYSPITEPNFDAIR